MCSDIRWADIKSLSTSYFNKAINLEFVETSEV